ncbi:hypothetical protein [Streptomyces sp. NPDC059564]|uniref:hypothetical protein n=1 Tax=Streptomyces sp. NPDC059564 TaxID=3346865 RepID=UPI0036B9B34C
MENLVWDELPEDVRAHVDGLLVRDRRIMAVKAVRDACPEPAPGIRECVEVLERRRAVLLSRRTEPAG